MNRKRTVECFEVPFLDRHILVENVSPAYENEEKKLIKKDMEQQLYSVFQRYFENDS